jgi:hypothetical protein
MVAMAYARKPSGNVVPRADYSVGGVRVVDGGAFGYFDTETMQVRERGAEYLPLRFDERCRSVLLGADAAGPAKGPIDRNIEWVSPAELPVPLPSTAGSALGPMLAPELLAKVEAPWVAEHAVRLGLCAQPAATAPSKL